MLKRKGLGPDLLGKLYLCDHCISFPVRKLNQGIYLINYCEDFILKPEAMTCKSSKNSSMTLTNCA